uniref:Tudor domain-containing protein n=2 Tax=Graphocephala atropunctata TaxID=36148 RepID=A0A1B6L4L0_9HEMI
MSMHYATYMIDCNKLNGEEEEIIEEPQQELSVQESVKSISAFKPVPVKQELTDNISSRVVSEITDWFDTFNFAPISVPQEPELKYKGLIFPDTLVELLVQPTIITGKTTMSVIIINCDDAEIMGYISEKTDLQEHIQSESELMPLIVNPVKGMACVGCYTEDDVWYRATILDVLPQQNAVSVFYVDYGNTEKLPLQRIRKCKEEWTKVPMMSFFVTLWKVTTGPEFDLESCITMLTNSLASPPYTMIIEAREPCLQVELFTADGEIAYQSLIDVGLLANI